MDELRRVRDLADDAPSPDPARKAQAREQLLAMAEEEAAAAAPAPRHRLAELLERARARLSAPVPAVGAAAVAVLALAVTGALLAGPLSGPGDDGPVVADRDDPPSVSDEPQPDEPQPDTDPPGEHAPGEDAEVVLAGRCDDPDGRYSVAYPQAWFTPEPGENGACELFAAEPFEVGAAVGGQALADVELAVEPTALDAIAEPGPGLEIRTEEHLEVDGRTAVRQELVATGDGRDPQGTLVDRYLVDLDDATLVASVRAEDEPELEQLGAVLARMVDELTLTVQ